MSNTYLAVDFGGGSGRVMAGKVVEGKLILEQVHRFANRQVKLGNYTYWDFLSLFEELKVGLRQAAQKDDKVVGIGIDTWGVDFGLIDKEGNLLGNPVSYRDTRTKGMPEKVFKTIDEAVHYARTGIQVMPINTLFQLYSMKQMNNSQLDMAHHLLFMPDLFSYYLTGIANNEYCIASTSELLNARQRDWDRELIRQLGLPEHLFGTIVQPGTIRGRLKPELVQETGLHEVDVIAVGSHDTASAVVAVPSLMRNRAFLSSGTWSLLGVEVDEPILCEEARMSHFTNEGGVGGKIRFLRNITGLWILQRLMAEWKEQGEVAGYDELIDEASASNFSSFIDVDDASFQNPENMEMAIIHFCVKNCQQIPTIKAEFVRCIVGSLAYKYQEAVQGMNQFLPEPIRQLHIIGGGSQNKLLNQLTANALGIPVLAGPVEATAMGNVLVQAMAKGEIASFEELKSIVLASVKPKIFYPNNKF